MFTLSKKSGYWNFLKEYFEYEENEDSKEFNKINSHEQLIVFMTLVLEGRKKSPIYGFRDSDEDLDSWNNERNATYMMLRDITKMGLITFESQDADTEDGIFQNKANLVGFIKKDILDQFLMLLPPFIIVDHGDSLVKADLIDYTGQDVKQIFNDKFKLLREFAVSSCLDFRKNNKVIKDATHIHKTFTKGRYLMSGTPVYVRLDNESTARYTNIGSELPGAMNHKYVIQFIKDYAVITLMDTRWDFPAGDRGGLFDIVLKILSIM